MSLFRDFTEIVDGLWMGRRFLPILPRGFGVVVNCKMTRDWYLPFRSNRVIVHVPFVDWNGLPPQWMIDAAMIAVAAGVESKVGVLVHCAEGHNRSGLIVASYLVRELAMKPADAVELIQAKRGPQALSNQTFLNHILSLDS